MLCIMPYVVLTILKTITAILYGDFEYCPKYGAPTAKRWPDILDESDDGFVKDELRR